MRGVVETVRLTTTGEASAREVLEESIARIDELNPRLNAFTRILAEEARAEADERDAALARGEAPGPLHGVPVAIKEEIDVAGCVTTYGGRANTTPAAADSEVVRRLRAAGAVVVGKTAMPEFGSFPFTESEHTGYTLNPWDESRSPGGSSGGTAVAVATGMVPVGLGGDAGGSIRVPSAFTGVYGLKPQRGRVTTAPQPHLWWALGVVGPLARSVADSALVYDVVRGNLPTDLYRAGGDASFASAAAREPGRLRVGWSLKVPSAGVRLDPVHAQAVRDTAALLTELGHDVAEVDVRYPDPTAAFVPQFLAGVRTEADQVDHFDRLERRTRETYRLGSWVTPRVRDAALRQTEAYSRRLNRVFEDVDVLLTPVTAHRPPKLGIVMGKGTVRSSLASLPTVTYMVPWNLAGNPAASVPTGIGADGLPVAVQLVGRTDDEPTVLSLSAQLERARPFPRWAGPAHGSPGATSPVS
ncbi:amidase [Nocardioides islandensis]|uniref:Amidase n=1 Tax=Nocardioides islandensis TaxID=433663 RepID=A0A930VHU8_9ACTN|nr:amidase [Nocardioides islandensis]MBF4764200.1 amidase [Nocardioides islandensis]